MDNLHWVWSLPKLAEQQESTSQLCSDPNNDSFQILTLILMSLMTALIDIPFRDFINLESSKMIYPVVAMQGILQADADIVPDDYQPDEQLRDFTPQYRTSTAEDIENFAQIRGKTGGVMQYWCKWLFTWKLI